MGWFSINRKNIESGKFRKFLSAAVWVIVVLLALCVAYGSIAQKKIADNVIRLHIIANSDDEKDQELKLKVRDAVIAHMRDKYPEGASMDEAVAYVSNNLSEIRRVAEGVVRRSGSDMKVSVRFGEFPFPTKAYEDITLPAGMYRSVRIELGEARGKNWWCVMFPPLCIADDNTMRMSPESREQLKATIGEEGYRLVTDVGDGDDTEIKVKFKIVELVQSSRLKLAELISRLF